jgi:VanZ family protein
MFHAALDPPSRPSPWWRRLWLWAPVAIYMAAIFVVSSMPGAPLPAQVSDKAAHAAAYALLAVLVVRALAGGLPAPVGARTAALAVVIVTAHGVSDEFHQWFVPGRSADPLDVLADAAGAMLGVGLCWAWGIIRFARPR